MTPRHPSIAELNDVLRTTFLTGRVVLTEGITSLPDDARAEVISAVRSFTAFAPGDDPYGEHDFGALSIDGAGTVFWKIDYYDPTGTWGSDAPADPAKTLRVLTIMLGVEY